MFDFDYEVMTRWSNGNNDLHPDYHWTHTDNPDKENKVKIVMGQNNVH